MAPMFIGDAHHRRDAQAVGVHCCRRRPWLLDGVLAMAWRSAAAHAVQLHAVQAASASRAWKRKQACQ